MADCVLACMVVVVVVDGRVQSPLVANFVQCMHVAVDVDVMRIVGSSESLVVVVVEGNGECRGELE